MADRQLPIKLAWIYAVVSEKPELTDRHLRRNRSSSDKVKQSYNYFFPFF